MGVAAAPSGDREWETGADRPEPHSAQDPVEPIRLIDCGHPIWSRRATQGVIVAPIPALAPASAGQAGRLALPVARPEPVRHVAPRGEVPTVGGAVAAWGTTMRVLSPRAAARVSRAWHCSAVSAPANRAQHDATRGARHASSTAQRARCGSAHRPDSITRGNNAMKKRLKSLCAAASGSIASNRASR